PPRAWSREARVNWRKHSFRRMKWRPRFFRPRSSRLSARRSSPRPLQLRAPVVREQDPEPALVASQGLLRAPEPELSVSAARWKLWPPWSYAFPVESATRSISTHRPVSRRWQRSTSRASNHRYRGGLPGAGTQSLHDLRQPHVSGAPASRELHQTD